MIRPLSSLGYLALAVLMGGALGLLRGPAAIAVNPLLLLIPFLVAAAAQIFFRKANRVAQQSDPDARQQLQAALIAGLPITLVVLTSESLLILDWPSAAGFTAGFGAGVAAGLMAEPMGQGSSSAYRIRVLLLYLAAGIVALSTLLTSLPPAAFWVVSAVIPAWQARRLALRDQMEDAARMLVASIRLFMAVLTIALVLPAALMLR
ncbi:MAG: hypothetical protein KGP33_04235 [Betaproteobacteria bacterium]|jgi:hypothetical protein|nr:hypothetical protein [Betaproteobacteria bacterium]